MYIFIDNLESDVFRLRVNFMFQVLISIMSSSEIKIGTDKKEPIFMS